MHLSNEEMWRAVVECNSSKDGEFYYALKSVGVYCRPSCKSRTPLQKNIIYFKNTEEAEHAGFRPCKRCRPDLLEYAPQKELAKQFKALMDTYLCDREKLKIEIKKLGVCASHLSVIFKRHYEITPSQYLNKTRITNAKKILSTTNIPIIDVASKVGFESLPSFYVFFKRYTKMTPKMFRETHSLEK